MIDGQTIATNGLRRQAMPGLYAIAYIIPATLLKGKQEITVRLQALPGKTAGGLFSCRLVKPKKELMRAKELIKIIMAIVCTNFALMGFAQPPKMYFSDSTDTGIPLAKDPVVIKFGGRYLMYYFRKAYNDGSNGMLGWNIGIAQSNDLYHWKKNGEIKPEADYEKKEFVHRERW